jgi:hypothetical protein
MTLLQKPAGEFEFADQSPFNNVSKKTYIGSKEEFFPLS